MAGSRPELDSITERLIAFRDERDWRQFHSLKDLIISLNLEAGELLELTQWKNGETVEEFAMSPTGKARLEEECADILLYLLLVAERADIDLVEAAHAKIALNEQKYPVDKARGTAKKYSDL